MNWANPPDDPTLYLVNRVHDIIEQRLHGDQPLTNAEEALSDCVSQLAGAVQDLRQRIVALEARQPGAAGARRG